MLVAPYQSRFDQADLIVIATVERETSDTAERTAFKKVGMDIHEKSADATLVGVETVFGIHATLRGKDPGGVITLHHYRMTLSSFALDPDGSVGFISFDKDPSKAFLLLLKKESDGRYAPALGQINPKGDAVFLLDHFFF
jgi:hypothetical protein